MLGIKSSLPMLDVLSAAGNSVETLFFAAVHIEVATSEVSKVIGAQIVKLTQCTSMAMQASRILSCLWTIPSSWLFWFALSV